MTGKEEALTRDTSVKSAYMNTFAPNPSKCKKCPLKINLGVREQRQMTGKNKKKNNNQIFFHITCESVHFVLFFN